MMWSDNFNSLYVFFVEEFLYKRTCSTSTMDLSNSELPTKLLKYDEMQGESRDKDLLHSEENVTDKCCTGTQTWVQQIIIQLI